MIYTVHLKQSAFESAAALRAADSKAVDARFDTLVAIPEAVSKWALILAPFWLMYRKLWFALLVYILLQILIFTLLATPYALAALLLSGLPGLYLFLEGNQLRRDKLERHGWKLVDVVQASDEKTALERALARWQDQPVHIAETSGTSGLSNPSSPRAMPRLRPGQSSAPTFGMFPVSEG